MGAALFFTTKARRHQEVVFFSRVPLDAGLGWVELGAWLILKTMKMGEGGRLNVYVSIMGLFLSP